MNKKPSEYDVFFFKESLEKFLRDPHAIDWGKQMLIKYDMNYL